MFEWGRRASDRATSAPAEPLSDQLLESVIAHEQIEVLYQPLIEPKTGRIVGAEALARAAMASSGEALFSRASAAGLDERLSRLVQRKALRCAAAWEGPLKGLKISVNLLPKDLAREAFDQWLLDEIEAAGIDPKRVVVEITESALLIDQPAVAERLGRLRAEGLQYRGRRLRHRLRQPRLSDVAPARHDQDRSRPHHPHRRRRARPDRGQGDDPPRARARASASSSKASKAPASSRSSPSGAAISTRGSSARAL